VQFFFVDRWAHSSLIIFRFEDQQGLDKILGDLFDLFDADKVG
jgi:hypothetical protein